MKCIFCGLKTNLHREPHAHIIVTIGHDNSSHVHGPVVEEEDKPWVKRTIVEIAKVSGVNLSDIVSELKQLEKENRDERPTIQ